MISIIGLVIGLLTSVGSVAIPVLKYYYTNPTTQENENIESQMNQPNINTIVKDIINAQPKNYDSDSEIEIKINVHNHQHS